MKERVSVLIRSWQAVSRVGRRKASQAHQACHPEEAFHSVAKTATTHYMTGRSVRFDHTEEDMSIKET